jgi:hypothetical protein
MATKHTRASRQLRGDAAPSVERAAGHQYDGSVVGHRVKVNWRGQGTWFTGVVKDYAPATQKHLVKYDHDDQFPEHDWHLLGNEEQQRVVEEVHSGWRGSQRRTKLLSGAVRFNDGCGVQYLGDDAYTMSPGLAALKIEGVFMREQEVALLSIVLRRNTDLRELKLSCGIDDKSGAWVLDALRANQTLIDLDLSDNNLGLLSCQAFRRNFNDHDGNRGNHALIRVALSGCGLNDEAAKYLAKGLQATKNMTLTKLILRRNELTRIGADFFFEVLERRPNLSRRITIELFQNKEIPKGLAENVARAVSTKAPTAGGGSAASSAYTTE